MCSLKGQRLANKHLIISFKEWPHTKIKDLLLQKKLNTKRGGNRKKKNVYHARFEPRTFRSRCKELIPVATLNSSSTRIWLLLT